MGRAVEPDDHEIAAFVAGYGADPDVVLAQAHDLQLLHALDVTRWAMGRAPERIPEAVAHARKVVKARLAVHFALVVQDLPG